MPSARLPAVIKLFASFDGREKGAIENVSRELRKEGLLTQGKRGVGAPIMAPSDYTNLMLSYGSRRATDAAECVRRLRYSLIIIGEEFAEKTRFARLGKDDDGLLRAGRFLDNLFIGLSIDGHRVLNIGGLQYMMDSIEIHDPITGLGHVKVKFYQEHLSVYEVVEFFYHERTNEQTKIQNAAIISDEIIWSIATSIRGEEID